jgi:multiple sugar transport system substrate-binding protein
MRRTAVHIRRLSLGALAALALAAGACGGDDDEGGSSGGGGGGDVTLEVWTNEFQPDRVKAFETSLAKFTEETGMKTKVVAIPEDQLSTLVTNATAAGELPDVIAGVNIADSQRYAKEELFDAEATQEVVDALGPDTFSEKALELASADGAATLVPSDGWGQLLIYRKDLFDEAGLEAPQSLEDVRAAAEQLNKDGVAGITLATAPGDGFTSETFEHIALAEGCQLVDDGGSVTIDSPECVQALEYYADLATNFSVQGNQDVDSTRGTYFAGQAAMMFWSPFLLDGMAGLRNDTKPSCDQCKKNPAYLAENSGLVGPLSGSAGSPSQFGVVSGFAISVDAQTEEAKQLVEWLMNDGYVDWLALSPQGKYPVRLGDQEDPERFAAAWSDLESGVDTKAKLSEFYSEDSITSLKEGVESFSRWAFPQGQGALLGALSGEQPVATAVNDVINGKDPAEAASELKGKVEEIKLSIE